MNSLGLCLVLVLTMVEVRVAGEIPSCVNGKTTPGNVPFCLPQDYDKVMSDRLGHALLSTHILGVTLK